MEIAPDLASKAKLLRRRGGQTMTASPAIESKRIGDNHAQIVFMERAFMNQRRMEYNVQYECPTHTGPT
jgi:hypothetical protein